MLKKVLILIACVTVILGIYFYSKCNFKNKIMGTWVASYIGYDNFDYTIKYVFERDNSVSEIVIRPDGTTDTYPMGKYRLKYKNRIVWKLNTNESPYYEMQYDSNEEVLYSIIAETKVNKFTKE